MAAMDTTADSATATLEDAELQAADAGEPVALGAAAATLMLAYISADQLEDARHLWRRTPEAARAASGDLRGAWAAAAALRGRAAVPSALAALDAGPWGAAAAPLAAEAAGRPLVWAASAAAAAVDERSSAGHLRPSLGCPSVGS